MHGTFEIPTQLPGMNEIIAANRSSPHIGAKQKKAWTGTAVTAIRHARTNARLARGCYQSPVSLFFDWFEADDKTPQQQRDPDNIMAGQKFILDGMVKERVIADDGPENIASITHRFHLDKEPRVVVDVYEIQRSRPHEQVPGTDPAA